MPEIKLEHVTKRWAKFYAVEDLNLTIENNAFVTLLGPSGCGKTTTLRMIAGLETPTSGRITIGDKVVFDSDLGINVPANKRKVGFLFQNYALWPNMTVYQNISFGLSNIKEELPKIDFEAKNAACLAQILQTPSDVTAVLDECRDKDGKLEEKKAVLKLIDAFTLSQYTAKKLFGYHLENGADCAAAIAALQAKVDAAHKAAKDAGCTLDEEFRFCRDGRVVKQTRKLTKEEIDLSVRRVSRIVKIGMFMDRYPAELSGGQQQRVAIARTLAPEPTVLFMDEPLSNLDAKMRTELRDQIIRLHERLKTTFVYVTHDQAEAMQMGDRLAIMDMGRIVQTGTPQEIYDHPNSVYVAGFVGAPKINFFASHLRRGEAGWSIRLLGKTLELPAQRLPLDTEGAEDGMRVILGVRPEDFRLDTSSEPMLQAEALNVLPMGAGLHVQLRCGEVRFLIVLTNHSGVQPGDTLALRVDPWNIQVFDAQTERNLCCPVRKEDAQ